MVFYRKYRPQTIDDLDNAAIRETLLSVFSKTDSAPHAFLFTGPKGLGKTSTARIIAKVVNCTGRTSKSGVEPCNKCESCLSITNGTNMDVIEIDAASNRGIDEIRDLKEKIRLAPLAAKKKIYIIDEVHMLTTEAFNALLKTLEEPPEHAMFVLATTEPHKVPATIMSRCFHLAFKPATEEELVRSFKRIVKGEKIDITDEALKYIANLADRGFRDGVKVLEEIASLAKGEKITKELLEEKYKSSGITIIITNLLDLLKKRDAKESLIIVQQLVDQGIDIKYFIDQLIRALHALMLIRINGQPAPSALTLDEIKELVELLSKAYQEMKFAVLPQLPLELAIIEYCEASSPHPNPLPKGARGQEGQDEGTSDEVTVSSLRQKVGTMQKIKALYGEPQKEDEPAKKKIEPDIELMHVPANGEVTKEWLTSLWKHLIIEMKNHNHTVAGVLRSCAIRSYDNKTMIIETAYKFHKERLDEMKTRDVLIQICKTLTGKDVQIEVELKNSN